MGLPYGLGSLAGQVIMGGKMELPRGPRLAGWSNNHGFDFTKGHN